MIMPGRAIQMYMVYGGVGVFYIGRCLSAPVKHVTGIQSPLDLPSARVSVNAMVAKCMCACIINCYVQQENYDKA